MSSLASQLAGIATAERHGSDKYSWSFLFDSKEAAEYDIDSIFDLGNSGLQELIELDGQRFKRFTKTLFNSSMKGYDRALKTREENSGLDENISMFLMCMSQYFLSRSAGKCLEWLIRRFRVNEFNIEALLETTLPFHDTPQFSKLASLLRIKDDSAWAFITMLRRPIRPLPREMLVDQCVRRPELLRALNDMLALAVKRGLGHKTLYNFYSATMVLSLQRMRRVDDNLITLLLPTILNGIKPKGNSGYRVTAMLVLNQLASRTTFSTEALTDLLLLVVKTMFHASTEQQLQAMLCVLFLTQSQEHAAEAMTPAVVTALLDCPDFATGPLAVCQAQYDLTPFLKTFIPQLVAMTATATDNDVARITLQAVLVSLHAEPDMIRFALQCMLEQVMKVSVPTKGGAALNSLRSMTVALDALRQQHSEIVTRTIDEVLRAEKSNAQRHTSLYNYLACTMKGTEQQMIAAADTPLFLALHHADADIRQVAFDKLGEMIRAARSGTATAAQDSFIRDALQARLQAEDSPSIINAMLKLPDLLAWMDPAELFQVLKTWVEQGGEIGAAALEYIIRKFLPAQAHNESQQREVLGMLLPMLLLCGPSKASVRVCQLAIDGKFLDNTPLADYRKLVKLLQPGKFVDYNKAYLELLASIQIGDSPIVATMLHRALEEGRDQTLLLALLLVPATLEQLKQDPERQTQQALAFTQQLAALLSDRLRQRAVSEEARKLLSKLADISVGDAALHLNALLVAGRSPSELLYPALVSALRSVSQHLTPPTDSVCWQEPSEVHSDYANALCTLFQTVFEQPDMQIYEAVTTDIFARHIGSSPIAFLFPLWTDSELPILLRSRCMEVVSLFLSNLQERPTPLDGQLLIPMLLLTLTDEHQRLRTIAGECLAKLHQLYTLIAQEKAEKEQVVAEKKKKKDSSGSETFADIYGQSSLYGDASSQLLYLPTADAIILSQQLMAVSSELTHDPDYIATFLAQLLSHNTPLKWRTSMKPITENYRETILSFLLSNVLAMSSIRLRCDLLKALRQVQNPLKLRHLAHLLPELLTMSVTESHDYAPLLVRCIDSDSGDLLNSKTIMAKCGIIRILEAHESKKSDQSVVGPLQLLLLERIQRPLFATLSSERQNRIFTLLVRLAVTSQVEEVTSEARRIIKELAATPAVLAHELARCQQELAQVIDEHRQKRCKLVNNNTLRISQSATIVLELLQMQPEPHKANQQLVLPLFDMLAVTLSLDSESMHSTVEYMNQLIMSAISRLFRQLQELKVRLQSHQVRIDLIVQCLRGTTNPQTHGQALLLLAALAGVQPELVLQNIMPVFTFMGASVLRQDDNYSFYIIQQTLEKIVPALVASCRDDTADNMERVRGVVSVFVDSLFHIPRHRRLGLFTSLVSILGADRYFYHVLALLLTKYTERMSKSTEDADTLMAFTLQLTEQFPSNVQLLTLQRLIGLLNEMPNTKQQPEDDSTMMDVDSATITCPVEVQKFSNKQIRQFKWAVLDFSRQLLESRAFLERLVDTKSTLEAQYLTLSESLLCLVDTLAVHERALTAGGNTSASVIKYWRSIVRLANDVLNGVNRLLSLPTFMRIISQLLKHENASIRRKSMLLFNEKVESLEDDVANTETSLFLGMLPHLTAMIAIKAKPHDREAIEIAINKQTALVSLALLVKHFGRTDAPAFIDVLKTITGKWALGHENRQVAASSIICLSVYCRELGPRVVQLLPHMMTNVFKYMQVMHDELKAGGDAATAATSESSTLMKLSILGLFDVMARHMTNFMSPYLSKILRNLLHPAFISSTGSGTARITGDEIDRTDQVTVRAKAVLSQLAQRVPTHQLLPPTIDIYGVPLLPRGTAVMKAYYAFVGQTIEAMNRETLLQHYKPLFKFFLDMFDARNDIAKKKKSSKRYTVQALESFELGAIQAFLQLVVKMNETMFRPVFLKIVDWALGVQVAEQERAQRRIFFYRFLGQLFEQLKSIVVPYFVYVLDDVIQLLQSLSTNDAALDSNLWRLVMQSVHKCLLYDNDGFWTTSLSEKILPALVHQLEVQGDKETDVEYMQRIDELVVPCIGQLANTAGTDVVWKPLNAQVLLKSRDSRPAVRVAALKSVRECYDRLGEEFLILLPETIPFLAELMEDDDTAVERLTQDVIKVIERHLGEPLQKYFE